MNRLSGISGLLKRVLVKSVEKQLGDGADAAINKAVEESGKVIDAAKLLPGIERLL